MLNQNIKLYNSISICCLEENPICRATLTQSNSYSVLALEPLHKHKYTFPPYIAQQQDLFTHFDPIRYIWWNSVLIVSLVSILGENLLIILCGAFASWWFRVELHKVRVFEEFGMSVSAHGFNLCNVFFCFAKKWSKVSRLLNDCVFLIRLLRGLTCIFALFDLFCNLHLWGIRSSIT